MNVQLFEGERVCLAAPELDKDAPTMSKWTHDADFLHKVNARMAKPLSASGVKKRLEEIAKDAEANRSFYFAIRERADGRLLGYARLDWIEWSHGCANLFEVGIGSPDDRGKGFGSDAARLMLRYGFDELNLYRIGARAPAHNDAALRWLTRFGFKEEVRRREAIGYLGARYDDVWLGLLREEWLR